MMNAQLSPLPEVAPVAAALQDDYQGLIRQLADLTSIHRLRHGEALTLGLAQLRTVLEHTDAPLADFAPAVDVADDIKSLLLTSQATERVIEQCVGHLVIEAMKRHAAAYATDDVRSEHHRREDEEVLS